MGFKIQMVGLLYLLVPIIESVIVLDSATIDTAWYHYKAHFNKDYDEVREMTRKPAFLKSLRYVITKNLEHDLTGHWYMAGLNAVADFTTEELHCFKSPTYNADVERSLSREISANAKKIPNFNDTAQLPTSDIRKDVQDGETEWGCFCIPLKKKKCPNKKNWVDKDRVYKVGEQKCGDCYAWAATYALSSAWAIKTKKSALDLSVQQAKDCSYHIYNQNNISLNDGCEGGNAWQVYAGIQNQTLNKMVQSKDYLKYNAHNGSLSCNTAKVIKSKSEGATIQSPNGSVNTSECELERALQGGPVVADICMSPSLGSWTSKKGIIYSNLNCTVECQAVMRNNSKTDTNHAVLIVGYTPTSWIIQNSYSTHWAYKGIGHLARGGNLPRICNLAGVIWWPTV